MENGSVLIIDDDEDEHEMVQDIWKELNIEHQLLFFSRGEQMIDYLSNHREKPFLIICDVNLPGMSGFELRKQLMESPETHYRSIPFIFWSHQASGAQIKTAYEAGGQGFFIKESRLEEIKTTFKEIINYWTKSKTPAKDNR